MYLKRFNSHLIPCHYEEIHASHKETIEPISEQRLHQIHTMRKKLAQKITRTNGGEMKASEDTIHQTIHVGYLRK